MRGFTDRNGGVSEGPFRSLNLSWSTGDDPGRVQQNRRRAARLVGWPEDLPVHTARQVHGKDVVRVTSSGGPGRASPGGRPASPDRWSDAGTGDILVITRPGQAAAVLVADCAPVLLWEPSGKAAVAAHAGWRGLAAGVVQAAVWAACEAASCSPEQLQARVGPAIRACCYRVGGEVIRAVGRAVAGDGPQDDTGWVRREGESLFLDVPEAVRAALIRSGVPPERCRLDGRCTACHPELFYSHRRDGPRTGRMAGIIGILEG